MKVSELFSEAEMIPAHIRKLATDAMLDVSGLWLNQLKDRAVKMFGKNDKKTDAQEKLLNALREV